MKIKKLIVLVGKPKTGKTQTLINLTSKIKAIIILKPQVIKKNTRDNIGVWVIKKIMVGIVFAGDDLKAIKNGYNTLANCGIKLDTVICTCHKANIEDCIRIYGKKSAIVIVKNKANNSDNKICEKEILNSI